MRMLAGARIDGDVDTDDGLEKKWDMVTAGAWLKQTLEQMRDPNIIQECAPGADLRAELRPYQLDGVRWLWFLKKLRIGGCLADDMGLGKTIQIISLLLVLKRESAKASKAAPALLIVPASLVGNWKREIERFAPTLTVFYAHRSETGADDLESVARNPVKRLQNFHLVITTYGLARRMDWLERMDWKLIVLDEAQAIKNASSAQAKSIKKLRADCRFALTGTPVENQVGDLWSLFDFCNPGLLGTARQFKSYIDKLQKRRAGGAFAPLRRLVRPYILRRMKTDPKIVPDLPEKTEMRCDCTLSKKQATLYSATVGDFQKRLKNADGMARRGLVLSVLMQLKQICNHPAHFLHQPDFPPNESGKLSRLAQVCEPIVSRQEKMLVFTQFREMTEPLAHFLAEVFGRGGLVLHGGTSVKKRKSLVAEFEYDTGPPFFVISLKAGGSGLNLTAASHVVHFDRWWNPAVENQATDRAFRIGQTKNVLVHKFVCRGTVEERIDAMISEKQQLADNLLDEGAEAKLTEMTDEQLIRLVTLDLSRATASD
jgi:non-specific serine/threonine protein kinase